MNRVPAGIAAGRAGRLLLLCGLLLLPGGGAWAVRPEEVPNPRPAGGWVTDMADVVPSATEAELNRLLDSLEQDTGVEIAVVTVPDAGDQVPRDFATELFNRWGIGKAGRDDGVLILLVLDARRVEVETGYGIEPVLPDGRVGAILDRDAVPYFRQGDYGTGLLRTVEAMAQIIRQEYAAEGGPPPERPAAPVRGSAAVGWGLVSLALSGVALLLVGRGWRRGAPTPDPGPRLPALAAAVGSVLLAAAPLAWGGAAAVAALPQALLVLGVAGVRAADGVLVPVGPEGSSPATVALQVGYWLVVLLLSFFALASGILAVGLFGAAAVGGWVALRRDFSTLPRRCPHCSGVMRWLSERQEAAYLPEPQVLEQEIGSVDYDVWRCDACEETIVYPHHRPWSRYTTCPRCGYRTLATDRVTVVAPAYGRYGRERVIHRCRNCGFTRTYERRLRPQAPPPVIIGGWGWGGGRGGGGFGGGGFGGGSFGGGGSGGGGAGRGW